MPLRDYVAVLTQLGATTTLRMAPRQRPPTYGNLVDEHSSGDEDWFLQQQASVSISEVLVARNYMTLAQAFLGTEGGTRCLPQLPPEAA